jgi:hypothetical protein
VNKSAFIRHLLANPVKPGFTNRFMTNQAWNASRGQGAWGAAKRVGSEVATALTPTKSTGLLDNIGAGMQTLQGIGKGQEYYKMLQPKTVMAALRQHLPARKQASLGEDLGKALLLGTGLAAAGAGVGAAASGVGNMFTRLQAKRMFDELQRRHPEVKSNPKARQYYDLIVAYAPSLLRHPNAVGDFLLRQLQYPMSSVEFIKQLADLEATVSKTSRESTGANIGYSASQLAGSPVMQSAFPRKKD